MKTILIVDDEAAFAEALTAVMDKEKYEVIAASDGLKGLEAVAKKMPDAILVDIKMPNMNGIEFLEKLAQLRGNAQIPVIITSNDSSLETISRGAEFGIRGYIIKSNESLKTIVTMIDHMFITKPEKA
jgi:CheY-like chemotaxis protein